MSRNLDNLMPEIGRNSGETVPNSVPSSPPARRHRSVIAIDHDDAHEAHVTLSPVDSPRDGLPDGKFGGGWFRLYRDLVRGGIWAQLGPAAKSVLIVLYEGVNDHIRREQGQWLAWPSVPTIARLAGLAERNVYVALKELEARQLISKLAPGGGRRQTTYELRPIPKGVPMSVPMSAPKFDHLSNPPLTNSSGVTNSSPEHPGPPLTRSSGHPRRIHHPTPAQDVSQQRESLKRKKNNIAEAEVVEVENQEMMDRLTGSGLSAKASSKLVLEYSKDRIDRHLIDWEIRKHAGKKLGVAWLLAAIRDDYSLHAHTQTKLDDAKAQERSTQHRLTVAMEQERQRRLEADMDSRANARFDAMSDAQLSELASAVVEEFPWMFRSNEASDPRSNDKLKRLILGKLVHLPAGT